MEFTGFPIAQKTPQVQDLQDQIKTRKRIKKKIGYSIQHFFFCLRTKKLYVT